MVKSWRFPGLCIAMFLGMAVNAGAQNSLNSPYPKATNLTPPTYNYEESNSCATCHFIFGVDHMPHAVGLTWNSTATNGVTAGADGTRRGMRNPTIVRHATPSARNVIPRCRRPQAQASALAT